MIKNLNSTSILEYFELKYWNTFERTLDKNIKFEIKIKEWTDLYMVLGIEFEDPKLVSSDIREDRFMIKLLKPEIFVSRKTCNKLVDDKTR